MEGFILAFKIKRLGQFLWYRWVKKDSPVSLGVSAGLTSPRKVKDWFLLKKNISACLSMFRCHCVKLLLDRFQHAFDEAISERKTVRQNDKSAQQIL